MCRPSVHPSTRPSIRPIRTTRASRAPFARFARKGSWSSQLESRASRAPFARFARDRILTTFILKTPSDHRQVWNQKSENSPTYGNFENSTPPPLTSNSVFKPIRNSLTTFKTIFRISISYLFIYLNLRKIEGPF